MTIPILIPGPRLLSLEGDLEAHEGKLWIVRQATTQLACFDYLRGIRDSDGLNLLSFELPRSAQGYIDRKYGRREMVAVGDDIVSGYELLVNFGTKSRIPMLACVSPVTRGRPGAREVIETLRARDEVKIAHIIQSDTLELLAALAEEAGFNVESAEV